MADKSLNDCNGQPFFERPDILDPVPGNCGPQEPSLRAVSEDSLTDCPKRDGLGEPANCNPVQTGHIVDEPGRPFSQETITRYSQVLRACDQAMREMFSDLSVIDEDSVAHRVPITIAGPEKAVAFILQENVRKDNTLVVDRIRLPMLSLHNKTDITLNQSRYLYSRAVDYFRGPDGKPGWTGPGQVTRRDRGTVFGRTRGLPVDISYQLNAWTLYSEDMNQIIEQVFLKFDPIAYIRLQNVPYETIVTLESTANNSELEPGDRAVRVIRWQFNMRVETFIPQPLVRKQAVLDLGVDILNGVSEDEIRSVLSKLDIDVGDG
jgi:hypothetical protein